MNIAKYIDHTLLKPTATQEQIATLCREAVEHGFYAVCINGAYVEFAREQLKGTQIKIVTVIGFPLGAMGTKSKVQEAQNCINNGADEIDMVINIGWLKSGCYVKVLEELKAVRKAMDKKILKVILETCFLTKEEVIVATQMAINAHADFVKTSTGFGSAGATIEDVMLMKEVVCDLAAIKASGGIRDYETAKRFIDAGASRIGTSSGVQIVSTQKQRIA